MNGTNIKILVIDDDDDDLFLTCEFLKSIDTFQLQIETETNYTKACQKIHSNKHDIYIIDYLLGPHTGVELILDCVKAGVNKPYILLTGKGDKQIDIEATKAGAYDYLIKSEINTELLERSLRYSMQRYIAYQAVVESEKKFRDIFDKTTDIIFVLNSDMHFINFNAAMSRVLGYDKEDLYHKPITDLFAIKTMGQQFVEKIRLDNQGSNEEVLLHSKNGGQKTFIASYTKIVTDQQKIEYQGILFDYTLIKKSLADELLREKTEATNQLVRTLAHEIRNPLTNIDLSVSQLEQEFKDEENFYIEIIKRNSKRINDLIRELVNISKPQENKLEKLDIATLLDETLQRAIDRIELKKIKVERILPTANLFIMADNSKMQIALLNIIINAIEAMESEKGVLNISATTADNNLQISITDNGTGIEPAHLARLFQPYFTGKKNGMGLGLANTHSVIKSHKGDIDVESSPGKGTRFTILLPLALN
jgi:PAS domain S-box-containing protein